ncbi:hypothetical protein [Pseudooceanicola sp. MF1-13]|uniref:hypothetical protein n=1 Tax=Pseudooceanicola sp. MF1-13 TaxID=3379095 RepID=UPI0038923326
MLLLAVDKQNEGIVTIVTSTIDFLEDTVCLFNRISYERYALASYGVGFFPNWKGTIISRDWITHWLASATPLAVIIDNSGKSRKLGRSNVARNVSVVTKVCGAPRALHEYL